MAHPEDEVWKKVQALIRDPDGAEAALLSTITTTNKPRFCRHHNSVEIDLKERYVECCRCGTHLTPWEYIMVITEASDRIISNLNGLRKQCSALERKREEIERQIRNAKSRLSRQQKKLFK